MTAFNRETATRLCAEAGSIAIDMRAAGEFAIAGNLRAMAEQLRAAVDEVERLEQANVQLHRDLVERLNAMTAERDAAEQRGPCSVCGFISPTPCRHTKETP